MGLLYLCFGVYTIDGRGVGIYGRGATRPLIDYEAVDIPVLRENSVSSSHGQSVLHLAPGGQFQGVCSRAGGAARQRF
jgi:hypothetical protein